MTVFLVIIGLAAIWLEIANEITLRQRKKIIDIVYAVDRDYSKALMKQNAFAQVSYDKHLFHLFTLRNPYKLYDCIIFEE